MHNAASDSFLKQTSVMEVKHMKQTPTADKESRTLGKVNTVRQTVTTLAPRIKNVGGLQPRGNSSVHLCRCRRKLYSQEAPRLTVQTVVLSQGMFAHGMSTFLHSQA